MSSIPICLLLGLLQVDLASKAFYNTINPPRTPSKATVNSPNSPISNAGGLVAPLDEPDEEDEDEDEDVDVDVDFEPDAFAVDVTAPDPAVAVPVLPVSAPPEF